MEAARATETASFVRPLACKTIARTLFECGVGPVPISRLSMMSAENWPCSEASRRYHAPTSRDVASFRNVARFFFQQKHGAEQ